MVATSGGAATAAPVLEVKPAAPVENFTKKLSKNMSKAELAAQKAKDLASKKIDIVSYATPYFFGPFLFHKFF